MFMNGKELKMEIKQLEYFRAIVDEGTISGAARALHMTQPPLSYQMKMLEEELKKKFANIIVTEKVQVGGLDQIAAIMNNLERSSEKAVFDGLEKRNSKLAEEIRKRMFVFEDIVKMDDRSVQRFVRDCDTRDIVLALKGANREVADKLFANMSSRMRQNIEEDLEITTNVRIRDVEEAQQRIVGIIRDLEERNEIIILKGGKDEIIA